MWRVMLKRKDNMAEIICAFISRHDPANATIHQNTQKKKSLNIWEIRNVHGLSTKQTLSIAH